MSDSKNTVNTVDNDMKSADTAAAASGAQAQNKTESIKNPDDLSKYLRVAKAPVWFSLVAILLLLIGVIIWGACFNFETRVRGLAVRTPEGTGVCYVSSDDITGVAPGLEYQMGNQYGVILSVSESSAPAFELLSEYLMIQGKFSQDDLLFTLTLDQAPEAEFLKCQIITESVSPIDLLFNSTE